MFVVCVYMDPLVCRREPLGTAGGCKDVDAQAPSRGNFGMPGADVQEMKVAGTSFWSRLCNALVYGREPLGAAGECKDVDAQAPSRGNFGMLAADVQEMKGDGISLWSLLSSVGL
ncbi:hypothetical protein CBR_g55167 [Chara braunii]|uniref:Uncharacterized protein n=1 Tax=Chara braunii TaxID=69332 RepID=A0A388MCX0_CHABU|nr:hypothetical protein CBR_g55167 [Chara braunii]|eukprot:GBG92322.1 hypothetical protein CBR_g55167 [Chara braunii]